MIILWIIAQWSTERTTEIKELCEFQNNKWTDAHKLVMQTKAELLKKNQLSNTPSYLNSTLCVMFQDHLHLTIHLQAGFCSPLSRHSSLFLQWE